MFVLGGIDAASVMIALLGGGAATGLVALLKYRPEKDAVVVSAAQGAVIVQSGVIDALQEELKRAREERDVERTLRVAAEVRVRELEVMQRARPADP